VESVKREVVGVPLDRAYKAVRLCGIDQPGRGLTYRVLWQPAITTTLIEEQAFAER
jgi:hypothetical protein